MFFSGHRIRVFIAAVLLFAGLFSLYLKHSQIKRTGVISIWDRSVLFITDPVSNVLSRTTDKLVQVFQRYVFLSGVEKENEALRDENFQLKASQSFLSEVENENARLRALIDLKSRFSGKSTVARVISSQQQTTHQMIVIDKGINEGVGLRDAVLTPEGLVGQVVRVSSGYSHVLLITDPLSAVDGRIEPGNSRGLVVGKSKKLGLNREAFLSAFEYLGQTTEVPEQASVVTSGMDGLFPPGIKIGTVFSTKKKKYNIFQQAEIIPTVDFTGLREVLVVAFQEGLQVP